MAGPSTSPWLRWTPNGFPGRPGRWRLIRFESVDADGKPVGKPIEALSAGGHPLCFRSEFSAQFAADHFNREEGLADA